MRTYAKPISLGARLDWAVFSDAKLDGSTLARCQTFYTNFANTDLSNAYGLDEVNHAGPSEVGVQTLYKSRGKIPEAFLRGCGVPEEMIRYIPSLTGTALSFYSCFISYSHQDRAFARRLHDALQGRGIRCWLDEKQINPGDDIHDEIDRGIRLYDKVILCASRSALEQSWWVEKEIKKAFAKEERIRRDEKRKALALIPLALDRYILDEWEHGLKDDVMSRAVADFTGWESDNAKFESEFEKVVKALRTDDGGKVPAPEAKL